MFTTENLVKTVVKHKEENEIIHNRILLIQLVLLYWRVTGILKFVRIFLFPSLFHFGRKVVGQFHFNFQSLSFSKIGSYETDHFLSVPYVLITTGMSIY